MKHQAHCGGRSCFQKTSRCDSLCQRRTYRTCLHTFSPAQLMHTLRGDYAHGLFTCICSRSRLNTPAAPPTHRLCESVQLHPATWQEAPLLSLPPSATRELDSSLGLLLVFFYQAKIGTLQAYRRVRLHTPSHKRQTHACTEMRSSTFPVDMPSFVCLSAAERDREREGRTVGGRGGEA